jgi:4-hydroxy-tetrahydrodipicolinate reductase
VGIDYVLGEDDLVGRGIGTALIREFIRQVVRPTHPRATHVVARPDHRNRRSIRALEKNGFVQGLWVDTLPRPGEPPVTEIVCTLDLRADYAGGVSETSELKVSVIGAAGRMGSEVCRAVEAAEGMRLVGRFDHDDDLGDLGGADVVVEFSVPDASPGNVAHCVERGVHVVVGTTGWDDARLEALRGRLDSAPPTASGAPVGVLIAPNFAIGAILMMSFATQAARFYESVEVIELHHPDKVDAPSGTAARTARLISAARAEAGLGDVPDATTHDPEGARGARVDGIPVHSVRLRGLVAHQEVLLGGPGELLTIRHDSFDRASFMPGVLEGVRRVADHPGLTVGLEHYLGID